MLVLRPAQSQTAVGIEPLGYLSRPLQIFDIPAYRLLEPFVEADGRFPAELVADLSRIERVSPIVAGPIGHTPDQRLTRSARQPVDHSIDQPANRRHGFQVGAFAIAAHMIDFSGTSPLTDPDDKTVAYTYDCCSHRETMTDPDDGVFTYSHDKAGRLEWLDNPLDERTSFTYDEVGREKLKELADGGSASTTYDAAGQIKMLENRRENGAIDTSFSYTYDAAGNRTAVDEASGASVAWDYDNANQLRNEQRTGWAAYNITHTYDPAGNRTTMTKDGASTT